MKLRYNSLAACVGLLLASTAWSDEQQAAEQDRDFEQAVSDAWIDGKLESAYTFNPHLNPFEIDTDVENGVVMLSGTVDSDIDRDLAGEIAKGLEGVHEVQNNLLVDTSLDAAVDESGSESDADAQESRSFGRWVDDATTTAAVKTRLIGNSNIAARNIDVDTRNDVVTLNGEVRSDEEKDLAEQLAKNVNEVVEVRNELRVASAQ